jgi:AcrR family transcriptional regulator
MKTASDKASDRISRSRRDKFSERRTELASAALKTLAELGYARTSLREIAENTEFSHGVLHYYFKDKVDLIMCCVRQYKAVCVTRYDQIVATAKSPAQLRDGFAAAMAQTLRTEAQFHRLWYDLRTQSLFEASFQPAVAEIDKSLERMVWRVVREYAELSDSRLRVDSTFTYALFDGLFQKHLLRFLHGEARAPQALENEVAKVMRELPLEVKSIRAKPARRRLS